MPWNALDKSYKFASNLIPIGGVSKELCHCKVTRIQTRIVSGLLLGSPGTKSHSDVGAMTNVDNTIWGKVVASFESGS